MRSLAPLRATHSLDFSLEATLEAPRGSSVRLLNQAGLKYTSTRRAPASLGREGGRERERGLRRSSGGDAAASARRNKYLSLYNFLSTGQLLRRKPRNALFRRGNYRAVRAVALALYGAHGDGGLRRAAVGGEREAYAT